MGCGASSAEANNTQVPQPPQTATQKPAVNNTKDQPADKKPDAIAGKITSPNYTGKPSDSFIKLSKVPNPEDGGEKEKDRKLQSSARESSSLNKQGSTVKASSNQQHNPQLHVPGEANKKTTQPTTTTGGSKIVVSPSKVSIRMAESQAVEHTTTEGDTVSRNEKRDKTGYGTSSAIAGVASESRIQEEEQDSKKKNLKSSKKKGSVDPKLNALIKIYGFD